MQKLKNCLEGIVILAIGIFFLILALNVSDNPISYGSTWVNTVAQAKFLPIVMALAIVILGVVAIIQGLQGKMKAATYEKGEGLKALIVIAITFAYLFSIYKFGFRWPTVVFSVVSTVYFNWGKRKWWQMVIIAAIYIAVGLWGLPKLIGLRLI